MPNRSKTQTVSVPYEYKRLLDSAIQYLSRDRLDAARSGKSTADFDKAIRSVGVLYGYLKR